MSAAFAKMAVAHAQTHDTTGKQHSVLEKPAEIAMLIYPGMTALDLISSQQVFGYLSGVNVELVAKTKDPVNSENESFTRVSHTSKLLLMLISKSYILTGRPFSDNNLGYWTRPPVALPHKPLKTQISAMEPDMHSSGQLMFSSSEEE